MTAPDPLGAGAKGAVTEPQEPTTEAGRRVAIIYAIAALDGYLHPNSDTGGWWDIRVDPVIRLVERFIAEARAAAQFRPMGDNHHNAALCPYCTPARAAAPPDIDVERLRVVCRDLNMHDPDAWAYRIAERYVVTRLASPDATRREPKR